jgi:hypothetical protein
VCGKVEKGRTASGNNVMTTGIGIKNLAAKSSTLEVLKIRLLGVRVSLLRPRATLQNSRSWETVANLCIVCELTN